jgi:hypothetical protein
MGSATRRSPGRRRRSCELANPYLRFWLAVVAPHESRLQAGAAAAIWERLADTTWRSQILGPRWESVARARVARQDDGPACRAASTRRSSRTGPRR